VRGSQVLPDTHPAPTVTQRRGAPLSLGRTYSIAHTGQIGQQIYKITDLITASALGHDFCRHAEHASIHAQRAP
jgi:hypothetical protein